MSEAVPSSTTARAEPSVSTGAASVPLATRARRQAITRNASNETVGQSVDVHARVSVSQLSRETLQHCRRCVLSSNNNKNTNNNNNNN